MRFVLSIGLIGLPLTLVLSILPQTAEMLQITAQQMP